MMYCLTWSYMISPEKLRCVVGTFSDVKDVYNTMVEQDKVAIEWEHRLQSYRLHGARVDAVGVKSAPMLCWGTELKLDNKLRMHENVFEMT